MGKFMDGMGLRILRKKQSEIMSKGDACKISKPLPGEGSRQKKRTEGYGEKKREKKRGEGRESLGTTHNEHVSNHV